MVLSNRSACFLKLDLAREAGGSWAGEQLCLMLFVFFVSVLVYLSLLEFDLAVIFCFH